MSLFCNKIILLLQGTSKYFQNNINFTAEFGKTKSIANEIHNFDDAFL